METTIARRWRIALIASLVAVVAGLLTAGPSGAAPVASGHISAVHPDSTVQPATAAGCDHNSSGYTSQKTPPPRIRVLRHSTRRVVTYNFTYYVKHVLPNEWIASWDQASLRSGALAVRDYAWFFVLHGSKGSAYSNRPCTFDVDDTTAYQVFDPGNSATSTNNAVAAVANFRLTTSTGRVPETMYCAGITGPSHCSANHDTCGEAVDGYHLSQWGSQRCAARRGYTMKQILNLYYPHYKVTKVS